MRDLNNPLSPTFNDEWTPDRVAAAKAQYKKSTGKDYTGKVEKATPASEGEWTAERASRAKAQYEKQTGQKYKPKK